MGLILVLLVLILLLGGLENLKHQHNLRQIPIRIHVNGSRGKSAVTRLIAGGLREAGYRVIAKSTGTVPMIILEDGSEIPLIRRGFPRIIEQLKIISLASKRKAEIVVIECMAIKPEIQWIAEKLIKSTLGVITNVRFDHCEEMGWTKKEIAETLALTTPPGGKLVTAEEEYFPIIADRAERIKAVVYKTAGTAIQDAELFGFPVPTFKDNIACALLACQLLGVERELALAGMRLAPPDPGALKVFSYNGLGNKIYFINAMAANDLASNRIIWESLSNHERYRAIMDLPMLTLFNNRRDRSFRARDLITFNLEKKIRYTLLTGEAKMIPYLLLLKAGIKRDQIRLIQQKKGIEGLLQEIHTIYAQEIAVFAFGNIKGIGLELIEFLQRNGEEVK